MNLISCDNTMAVRPDPLRIPILLIGLCTMLYVGIGIHRTAQAPTVLEQQTSELHAVCTQRAIMAQTAANARQVGATLAQVQATAVIPELATRYYQSGLTGGQAFHMELLACEH